MNYLDIYNSLIEERTVNQINSEVFEKHHIKPRALGGTNEKTNIVKLTPREHFIAHRLLAKIHGGSMWTAVFMMSGRGQYLTGKSYSLAREKHIKVVSEVTRKRWKNKEERESLSRKISKSLLKMYKENPQESEAISRSAKNMWKSEEYRKRFSEARRGIKFSEQAIENFKLGQTKRHLSGEEGRKHSKRMKALFKKNPSLKLEMAEKANKLWADEEKREKLINERLQRWDCPEYRKKMTLISREKAKDPNYIKKQSDAKKGKPVSEETRLKLSKALKGKIVSEETREKLSVAAKKRKPHKVSDETRRKMSESQKKRYNAINA